MIHPIPPTICLLLGITCLPHVDPVQDPVPALRAEVLAATSLHGDGLAAKPAPTKLANGKEFRSIDVSDLIGQLGNAPLPSVRLALQSGDVDLDLLSNISSKWLFRDRPSYLMEQDRLKDLIRSTIEPKSWDEDDVSIASVGTALELIHETAVLDEIESFLENLRLSLAPRLRLRCIAWKPAPGSDVKTAKLTSASAGTFVAKLLAGDLGNVVYDSQSECRSGSREHFSLANSVSYQGDLACEVAEGTSIYDPTIRTVHTGQEFWVQPLVDSAQRGVYLYGLFRTRNIADIAVREFPRLGASLELAKCKQGATVFSAWLKGGGAIVTRSGSYGLTVMVERIDPRPQPRQGFRALASGASFHGNLGELTGTTSDETAFSIGYRKPEIDHVIEQTRAVAQLGDQDGESVDSTGWGLLMAGGEGKLAIAQNFLVAQQRRDQRNFVIELRTEWNPATIGPARWESRGAPLELVCTSRHVAVAMQGMQQDYVADSNVEIAQKESITDPVIRSIFTGSQALVSVAPAGDALRVEIATLGRSLLDMRAVRSSSAKSNGLDCPKSSDVFYTRKLRVEAGKDVVLGTGPRVRNGDEEYRTRIVMRVREL